MKKKALLYPAADDEFERFECCLTGILDGRLYTIRSGLYRFMSDQYISMYCLSTYMKHIRIDGKKEKSRKIISS